LNLFFSEMFFAFKKLKKVERESLRILRKLDAIKRKIIKEIKISILI